MKINNPQISELGLGAAIVLALLMLINPFNLLMTSAYILTFIMILAVAVIAFGVFVWREQPRDEREAFHGMKAGHISYFVGGSVLVVAIIVQTFQHMLDVWLPCVLGAMVITKLVVSTLNRTR
jgi:uncharacterized membrane protein YidH (DUF202 family)